MENFFALTDQQKNVWNSEMFYSGTNINNIGIINVSNSVDKKSK